MHGSAWIMYTTVSASVLNDVIVHVDHLQKYDFVEKMNRNCLIESQKRDINS